jgi:hypothetical protein
VKTSAVGRWRIEFDPEATAQCYEQTKAGWGCDCNTCRNFAALDKKAFSSAAIELFARLEIDYSKPAEVYHNSRLQNGLHDYRGWFHFIGRIESGPDAWKRIGDSTTSFQSDLEQFGQNFGFGFSNRLALVRESFRDRRLIQLKFDTKVPWVLSEPPPS